MIATSAPTISSRLSELYSYRELVSNLALRDFRTKHKRSALGVFWSFLNPLFMMLIYATIFGLILHLFALPAYWAFILAGLLPWTFFASALTQGAVSFANNSDLITKVYFPIESLAISSVLSNFLNFVISIAVLLPILVVGGRPLGPSLVALPLVALLQLVMCAGLGLLVATLNVYFRDLEYLLSIALQALFYVSPVLYPLSGRGVPSASKHYLDVLKLNPISWYLESYHYVLYYGVWPSMRLVVLMVAFSTASLVAGYVTFHRLRARVPEEV